MKKRVALILAVVMAIGVITGCGKKADNISERIILKSGRWKSHIILSKIKQLSGRLRKNLE